MAKATAERVSVDETRPLTEVGKKARAFTMKDQAGATHKLTDYAGRWVVLYFYPKDDTPGCTKEACQFRDGLPDFTKADAVVLGVSPDDERSHAKFVAKHELNFTLLADPDASVCAKYGVWQEKSMYGKKYAGVVRTTYLIGPDGKVAARWDKVKVPGHAEAVLAAIRDHG
ncbi:thioredoxin-dependent thiol peroxidase [Mucisphaera calidilacus]|uniref:thioredoxin-dependent peroxiredoxin n=1 Tax=Mucisphaera calidilacus TaxID=2527982 RepID=A0A518BXU0_9BACT|nr:thioredoxin-dependent thiol peroxidase [Mucisphaera calidilacus]QDU71799.1 Putative peroxiredoxin bcp [Mucisphaera calidilacus]